MHPLRVYIERQLGKKLKERGIVVWYDAREEFLPFVEELREGCSREGNGTWTVMIDGEQTHLAVYSGSIFELRVQVEPFVCGDRPEPALLYLPGCTRDAKGSVLMELEMGGERYEPLLKKYARNLLREHYTEGVIDHLLSSEGVGYAYMAELCSGSAPEPPSILKTVFHEAAGKYGLLSAWLADDSKDKEIEAKNAVSELVKLIRSRLGLELSADMPLAKLRVLVLRYVLVGEFRSDLRCPPPSGLEGVPSAKTKADEEALRELALALRKNFPDAYAKLANRIEHELGLGTKAIAAGFLGAIDTFGFEERALLSHAGDLVAVKEFEDALRLVREREHSFWLDRDIERKAQWEACRRMAELGALAMQVQRELPRLGTDVKKWIEAYTAPEKGFYRLDLAQRRLEMWVGKLEDEPEERPLGLVRRAYDDVCGAMAEGFGKALAQAGWMVPEVLAQSRIFSAVVEERPKPVAYFLVDAMRFEMGVELAEKLGKAAEVSIRPAVCALPSITTIGMGALHPGASGSFGLGVQKGKLGVRIDDAFLPDVSARKKFFAARVPQVVDISLDELLNLSATKLGKRVSGAQMIVVRSQEIDHAGEAGFLVQARAMMDSVLDNLGRALRRLEGVGVLNAVITADHGHLFFGSDRDESMRMDAPGGETVEIHRRCWIGRGGAKLLGAPRVAATALGYDSDLDFVFPAGIGVFKAGGDLAFYHGGPSLQELIIPVISVRMEGKVMPKAADSIFQLTGVPAEITNRVVAPSLGSLLGGTAMPLLIHKGRKVGGLMGVMGSGVYNASAGTVTLEPGATAAIGLKLEDDTIDSVRIVLVDPESDAELYRSPADIPVKVSI